MPAGKSPFAVLIVGMLGAGSLPGLVAHAEPAVDGGAAGAVVVPLVGLGGRPAFCGTNHSGGRARPQDEGGYRIVGLAPGRHVVHLELTDERIDVLVTVAPDTDVVVPPVVVRGPCRALSLRSPVSAVAPVATLPAWTLRIGRRYQAQSGMAPAVFERDRGLMRMGAAWAMRRVDRGPQTRGL